MAVLMTALPMTDGPVTKSVSGQQNRLHAISSMQIVLLKKGSTCLCSQMSYWQPVYPEAAQNCCF